MPTKAEQLIQQQKSLAAQLRQAQLQQSQSSFNQGQRALKEQLRMQRIDSQASRNQLSEQGYMAARQIGQGASARGLGGSGLKDMSLVQSQLAQGRGVNDIAQGNAAVQRAAMGTQLSLQEQLANSRNAANAGYSENMINADKYGLQLDNEKSGRLMEYYRMAMEGGNMADIANIAALNGDDLASLTEQQRAAIEGATSDPYGDVAFNRTGGNSLDTLLGTFIGVNPASNNVTFNNNLGVRKYRNIQEAVEGVKEIYAGFEGSDKIIPVQHNFNSVRFEYNGKKYKTYNEALEVYRTYEKR